MSERSWRDDPLRDTEELLRRFEPAVETVDSARILYEAGRRAGEVATSARANSLGLGLALGWLLAASAVVWGVWLRSPRVMERIHVVLQEKSEPVDVVGTPEAVDSRIDEDANQRRLRRGTYWAARRRPDWLPEPAPSNSPGGAPDKMTYGRLRSGFFDETSLP